MPPRSMLTANVELHFKLSVSLSWSLLLPANTSDIKTYNSIPYWGMEEKWKRGMEIWVTSLTFLPSSRNNPGGVWPATWYFKPFTQTWKMHVLVSASEPSYDNWQADIEEEGMLLTYSLYWKTYPDISSFLKQKYPLLWSWCLWLCN